MFSIVAKRIGFNMSFVKKMAENIALNTQRAQRVQSNIMNEQYSIQQEAKLRQRVTVQSSIDNLEKELRKEIAQALKRSEGKVQYFYEKLNQMYQTHQRSPLNSKQKEDYNRLLKACEKARWEYMVHRHSCGFTIQNYKLVTDKFPLPPKL